MNASLGLVYTRTLNEKLAYTEIKNFCSSNSKEFEVKGGLCCEVANGKA